MEDEILVPFWLQFLLFCSLLFLIKRKIIKPWFSCSNGAQIPGPNKLPIIGNLHQLSSLPQRSLHQLSKKHGPVMLFHFCGVPAVIISSAEEAKQVLQTYDLECCSRPLTVGTKRLSYNYVDLGFVPYGKYRREIRKIYVLELFSSNRVKQSRFIREQGINMMLESISDDVQSSSTKSGNIIVPVNLSRKLMFLTAELICRVAFGSSNFGELVSVENFQELVHEAAGVLGSFSANVFFPYYIGWIIDRVTGYHGRLERVFHDLDVFYQKLIDNHLENFGRKKQGDDEDIIEVLLNIKQTQSQSSGFQITHDHIKGILMVRD